MEEKLTKQEQQLRDLELLMNHRIAEVETYLEEHKELLTILRKQDEKNYEKD